MPRTLDRSDGRGASCWSGPVRLGLATSAWVAWLITPATMGGESAGGKEPPTFSKDFAPILQERCTKCHRPGQVGPFPLETYEQARKRAADIASVVGERVMPPWKPAPGIGPPLKHDQSLSREQIAILEAWAQAGAPRGDPKDMPPPPRFSEDWKLGTPDLVLEPAEDFTVPASGADVYRCFVVPTNLTRDTYISAIDFRPGNRRVVHHISAYLDTSGVARERDKAEEGPGYVSFSGPGIPIYEELCFWNAGHEPSHLPKGIGLCLPRQSDVILQIHYHPSGKREVDRTRIGVYFSREPVKQALHWNSASNYEFRFEPGNSDTVVEGTWFVPTDVEALAVSPHMHLLGREMRMSVTYPDGHTIDLISIPSWDPAWQNTYYFQKPISLPKGSVVKAVAHFDNSAHSRNPNRPPKPVTWGHSVKDEMCDGFIAVVKKGQDLVRHPANDELHEMFAKQKFRAWQKI
ncbi:MAG: hypothetical protein QOD29_6513, partial [Alphaproteobacteria bacterium]|nr:hypothetical protein [Alphaproteobacteria bacterium]